MENFQKRVLNQNSMMQQNYDLGVPEILKEFESARVSPTKKMAKEGIQVKSMYREAWRENRLLHHLKYYIMAGTKEL